MENVTKHTRSKERVQVLGEVFTPPNVVNDMLEMLMKDKDWSEEGLTFFEPSCGNGNFVVELVSRRLEALYKRYLQEGKQYPEYRAASEAIHSVWAIDIDAQNITETRYRVYNLVKDFLEDCLIDPTLPMAFLVMNIADRIFQNECLTSLSVNKDEAAKAAKLTKASKFWFEEKGYLPMPFSFGRGVK